MTIIDNRIDHDFSQKHENLIRYFFNFFTKLCISYHPYFFTKYDIRIHKLQKLTP